MVNSLPIKILPEGRYVVHGGNTMSGWVSMVVASFSMVLLIGCYIRVPCGDEKRGPCS